MFINFLLTMGFYNIRNINFLVSLVKTPLFYSFAIILITSCVDAPAQSQDSHITPPSKQIIQSKQIVQNNYNIPNTLDFDTHYTCINNNLNISIRMPQVYAYNNDKSLLVISNSNSKKQVLKIEGISTVDTFNGTINSVQIEQMILLTSIPNSQLEIISYRANNSSQSQQSLTTMAKQLQSIKQTCKF